MIAKFTKGSRKITLPAVLLIVMMACVSLTDARRIGGIARTGGSSFEGTWSGMAVDKPEDGSSENGLKLELKIDEYGRLAGEAFGEFVKNGYCRLENLKVAGSQISFEVAHRITNLRMGVTLELKDGKLQGEGLPIDMEEDRCDITLRRESSAGPGEYTAPMPGRREAILYYSFDRDEGQTVTDKSGKGHRGSVHGARYESNGRIGGAMSFDGQDDFISVPEVRLEDFSFSAWVKTPLTGGAANNRFIFTLDDGMHYYALQGNVGGALSIVSDGEEINEYDWQFGDNAWAHLTLTHEGGTFKLYKNGALTQTGTLASSPVAGTLCIGGTSRHGGSFWQGMIDEVAVFSRALSETEVRQLYDRQSDKTSGRPERVSVEPPKVATGTGGTARFVGVWSGQAVDKPEDGSSEDGLKLDLKIDEYGRLAGEAFGEFVKNGYCRLENLKVAGNRISFEVAHRIANLRMGVTLELKDGTLQGEGLPIDIDEDRCDITLRRESSAGPGGYTAPMPGIREAILYYSFDRDEGQTVTDKSGKGHRGSVHGARYESNGRIGGAFSLDGEDDYISVQNVNLKEFSFSAWVKVASRGLNNRRIFTLDDGMHYSALQGNVRGGLSIVADGEEINEYDWQFAANAWTHLTLTHEAGSFKLYKDGQLTEAGHMSSSPVSGTLYIGGTSRHDGGFWQGMIDEVTIFNRALSETEVRQLYGKSGPPGEVSPKPPMVTGGAWGPARFAGTWSGMAVDKPGHGTSRDSLTIKLGVDEYGRLNGEAFGSFVAGGYCRVENLKVAGNQLSFAVTHRFRNTRTPITLDLRDGRLQGEGSIGGDRCDISLERKSAGSGARATTGVKKKG